MLPCSPNNAGKPNPVDWDAVSFFEYQTESEVVKQAYNVDDITTAAGANRPVDTLGPIVNTALVPYDEPLSQDARRSVLVIQWNEYSDWVAYDLNAAYDGTINKGTVTIAGRTIKEHCARYAGCSVSQPKFHNAVPDGGGSPDDPDQQQYRYVTMQVRVEISQEPYYWPTISRGYNHYQLIDGNWRLIPATAGDNTEDNTGVSDTDENAKLRKSLCIDDANQLPNQEDKDRELAKCDLIIRDSKVSEPVLLDSGGKRLPKNSNAIGHVVRYRPADVSYANLIRIPAKPTTPPPPPP